MKRMQDLLVTENEKLNDNYCLLKLTTTDASVSPDLHPGQFVEIKVNNSPKTYLRRPISVNYLDKEKNEMWLLIQIIGDGTKALSLLEKNDTLNLLYPLGNTFSMESLDNQSEVLLVGGGVGIAPMLFLASKLHNQGVKPNILIGARTHKDLLQLDIMKKYGDVYCTTEDGSYGETGFVTNHSILDKIKFDAIYTCGPKPMMQAIAQYANHKNIFCEVSLENMMACGFGVCLCCVEKTTKGNICVCKEGPVFNIKDLTWID